MGLDDISYHSISKVMETWELGRQKFGCSEEVGMDILMNMFKMDPTTMPVFGLKEDQDVSTLVANNPMIRMSILVHSKNIIKIIDGILSLLGPDHEMLEVLLSEQGQRHLRMGVKPVHISLLGDACREALSRILPKGRWNTDTDNAWKELFGELTKTMIKGMV